MGTGGRRGTDLQGTVLPPGATFISGTEIGKMWAGGKEVCVREASDGREGLPCRGLGTNTPLPSPLPLGGTCRFCKVLWSGSHGAGRAHIVALSRCAAEVSLREEVGTQALSGQVMQERPPGTGGRRVQVSEQKHDPWKRSAPTQSGLREGVGQQGLKSVSSSRPAPSRAQWRDHPLPPGAVAEFP